MAAAAGAFAVVSLLAALALTRLALSLAQDVLDRDEERRSERPLSRPGATALTGVAAVPFALYWFDRGERHGWTLLAMGIAALGLVVMRLVLLAESLDRDRDQLDHLAHHDPVSGLPNRVMFERRVRQLCSVERPPGVALLYVDLDNFKDINDRCGHEVGDRVLGEVGARLAASLRVGDIVARVGGDEFVVLVIGDRIEAAADRVAGRIQEQLSAPFRPPGLDPDAGPIQIRASIGVVAPALDLARALRGAEEAMYAAKQAGRNRIAHASIEGDHGGDPVAPFGSDHAGVGTQPAGERADVEVSGHAESDEGHPECDPHPAGE